MVGTLHGLRRVILCFPGTYMALVKREHVHNQDDDLHRLVMLHHGCAAFLEIK